MFGYNTNGILRTSLTALVFPTCASGHCLYSMTAAVEKVGRQKAALVSLSTVEFIYKYMQQQQ